MLSSRFLFAGTSFFSVALIYTLIIWFIEKPKPGQLVMGATSSAMNNANNMGLPVAIYVIGDAAQNAYNYASRYGVATVFVRDTVLLTTLLSLPAMLLTIALLR